MSMIAGVHGARRPTGADAGASAAHARPTALMRLVMVATAAVALVAGAATRAQAQDVVPPLPPIAAPTPQLSWNARVLAPVVAKAEPDHRAKAVMTVQPVAPLGGGPTILLVLSQREVNGQAWTKLLLPRRPNGSAGWVPSDYLRFASNPVRILIDQSSRTTYVFRNGRIVLKTRNAVGEAVTPTPNGHFAIAEKVLGPYNGFLGPVIMPTTGYSNVLNEYAGGNGRFAMHGTSEPEKIGTRASHGCIRHYNRAILAISRLTPIGTPVLIRW